MLSFAAKIEGMESSTNDSTRMDWIWTIVSGVIMILLLMYANQWFWLAMPFFFTYLVRALRVM